MPPLMDLHYVLGIVSVVVFLIGTILTFLHIHIQHMFSRCYFQKSVKYADTEAGFGVSRSQGVKSGFSRGNFFQRADVDTRARNMSRMGRNSLPLKAGSDVDDGSSSGGGPVDNYIEVYDYDLPDDDDGNQSYKDDNSNPCNPDEQANSENEDYDPNLQLQLEQDNEEAGLDDNYIGDEPEEEYESYGYGDDSRDSHNRDENEYVEDAGYRYTLAAEDDII